MKEKIKMSIMLFFNSLMISAFTFGGGYVIVSMMRKKYVTKKKLLTEAEMMDITTMAQASPGPIAVNSNLLLGFKLAGMIGAICCLLGTMIPPLVIITVIFNLQALIPPAGEEVLQAIMNGMSAGIAAIITDVVFSLLIVVKKERNKWALLTFPLTFALAFTFTHFGINIVFVILPAFAIAVSLAFFEKWRIDRQAQLSEPEVIEAYDSIEIEYDNDSDVDIDDNNTDDIDAFDQLIYPATSLEGISTQPDDESDEEVKL